MRNILKGGTRIFANTVKDPALKQGLSIVHDELERLQNSIPQMTPTPTPSQVVIGGSTSSGSSGTPVSSSNDRANFVAITSIVDQFISFSSAIPGGYELFVNMQDSSGTYGQVNVPRSDWLTNGFWLRKANIIIASPAVGGFLWYIAKANQ
jgi:hypothetical protein